MIKRTARKWSVSARIGWQGIPSMMELPRSVADDLFWFSQRKRRGKYAAAWFREFADALEKK